MKIILNILVKFYYTLFCLRVLRDYDIIHYKLHKDNTILAFELLLHLPSLNLNLKKEKLIIEIKNRNILPE